MVGQVMPITQFLDSPKFDPETNRVMAVAFDMACAALQLGDQSNLINERIAELSSMQTPANLIPMSCVKLY